MTNATEIRPLQPDDLSAAQGLIAAADLFPPELLLEMTSPYLTGTAKDRWLIAGQGQALAYAAPERMTEGTWNLLLLAVHPMAQRRGLGRAMIGAVEREILCAGGRLLLVETSGAHAFIGARRFYRSLGFDREARIRHFYQPGEDKVVFTRPLRR